MLFVDKYIKWNKTKWLKGKRHGKNISQVQRQMCYPYINIKQCTLKIGISKSENCFLNWYIIKVYYLLNRLYYEV